MATLTPHADRFQLLIEGECSIQDLTPKALEEVEQFAPFGPGNPEPLFSVETKVSTQAVLKGRHLKLKFTPGVEGIWFNAAEKLEYTELIEKVTRERTSCRFAGTPELNRFMGKVTPTLRIKDANSSSQGS